MLLTSSCLLTLLCSNLINANNSPLEIKGLDPQQQALYQSHLSTNQSKWTCLNDTKVQINVNQLNDGICDCPDGSDEPGTAACNAIYEKINSANKLFYCENDGFIPRYIDSSSIGDGICDCCDCSDEIEGENVCLELNQIYHNMIDGELQSAELGKKKLRSLFSKANIQIDDKNSDNLLESLEENIQEIDNELEVHKELLKAESTNYFNRLKQDDTILYQYESVDLQYIIDTINSTYDKVALNSKMFTDLIYIFETLAGTFIPDLNDKIVNTNVYKFQDEYVRLKNEEKIGISSDTDNEQRDQLLEYFTKELPLVFWKGESSNPPQYVINKAKFVKLLIEGKVEYTKTVFQYIDYFRAIMDDIEENHNVNFQDNGVKEAIRMYNDYLKKYEVQFQNRNITLPKSFGKEMDKLLKVVETNVPKILVEDEKEMNTGEKNVLMGFVSSLLSSEDNANRKMLRKLKDQIIIRKKQIKTLETQFNVKTHELDSMEQLQYVSDKETKENQKRLLEITDLIEVLSTEDTCIENVINGYRYNLCLNSASQAGFIYQTEDKPEGNQVLIGQYAVSYMNKPLIKQGYINKIKIDNLDNKLNILEHLTNSTSVIGQVEHNLGPLEDINNGFISEFNEGTQCWNGPMRAATVIIKCSNEFKINGVQEMTKCNYQFDVEGPWGCNIDR